MNEEELRRMYQDVRDIKDALIDTETEFGIKKGFISKTKEVEQAHDDRLNTLEQAVSDAAAFDSFIKSAPVIIGSAFGFIITVGTILGGLYYLFKEVFMK